MKKILARLIALNCSHWISFFVGLSMLICAWIQLIQHGRINIDSVLYFESAKLIANGEWQAAIKIYNWPFYATCLAAIHNLTTMSIELSAQCLNVVFFGMTTFSFLKIIELSGGKRLEIFAGALILLSARHVVGEMLTMQLRDQGFWAFLLLAIFFLLRFIKKQASRDALFWQIAILSAAIFRVEGFAYMLLLPIATLWMTSPTNTNKISRLMRCYSLTFVLSLLTLTMVLATHDALLEVSRLQELMPHNALQAMTQQLSTKSALITETLGKYLGKYTYVIFIVSFLVIIIIKAINATGIASAGLALVTIISKKSRIEPQAYQLLMFAALISVLALLFTLIKTFVIVGRYTAPLAFILFVLAAFSIRVLIDYRKKLPFFATTTLLFLLIFSTVNIVKNLTAELNQTFYVKKAATWLLANNPTHAPVLYDNILSAYYAHAPYSEALRSDMNYLKRELPTNAVNYAYLMIQYSDGTEQKEKELLMLPLKAHFTEIKRFNSDKKEKYIVIYKRGL